MLQFLSKAWPLILVAAPGVVGLSLLRLHTFQVKELKLKILELEKRLSDGGSVVIRPTSSEVDKYGGRLLGVSYDPVKLGKFISLLIVCSLMVSLSWTLVQIRESQYALAAAAGCKEKERARYEELEYIIRRHQDLRSELKDLQKENPRSQATQRKLDELDKEIADILDRELIILQNTLD
jgi:hypothetical protein